MFYPHLLDASGRTQRRAKRRKEGSGEVSRADLQIRRCDARKAKITHFDDPDYSKEAWQHGIKGRVLLRAVLCADGRVTNVEVIKGLPYGLTEKALATMLKMKFKPAQKDGHPVSVAILREFSFGEDW